MFTPDTVPSGVGLLTDSFVFLDELCAGDLRSCSNPASPALHVSVLAMNGSTGIISLRLPVLRCEQTPVIEIIIIVMMRIPRFERHVQARIKFAQMMQKKR